MPNLSELTDYEIPAPEPVPANIPRVYVGSPGIEDRKEEKGIVQKVTDRLLGLNGEDRYQLWPEKVVREGLSAAGDAMQQGTVAPGLRREDFTDIPVPDMPTKDSTALGKFLGVAPVAASPQDKVIEQAQAISALAGSGGLAGGAEGSVLNATPSLRPALKYKDKLYKGKPGQEHQDVIPDHLYSEFQDMAMKGEDISHYNFGFVNDKGHFLNREDALKYGIDSGLIDPQAGKFGALTSTLMADSSKPGTAIEAMAKADPFFSALEHNVSKIGQSKMTGDQWLGTLSNKPGVKPEELDWTGLKSFLQENGKAPVTKEQIEQHLASNKVELKEVSKGGDVQVNVKDFYENNTRGERMPEWSQLTQRERAQWAEKADAESKGNTKYHSYQLPGGENYREMLMTLPAHNKMKWEKTADGITSEGYTIKKEPNGYVTYGSGGRKLSLHDTEEMARSLVETSKSNSPNTQMYRSSHWDEPNILAHVRMNDRYMEGTVKTKQELANDFRTKYGDNFADKLTPEERKWYEGGHSPDAVKSLHLEEIQSDWHQQGRDKGYTPSEKERVEASNKIKEIRKEQQTLLTSRITKTPDGKYAVKMDTGESIKFNDEQSAIQVAMMPTGEVRPKWIELDDKAAELGRIASKMGGQVPDAPFKKTWHELALKRMIREAAEKGYDRLSWTPGEAQAARYDLSKQVDKIAVPMVNENGTRSVRIDSKTDSPFKLMVDKEGKVTGAGGSSDQFSGKPLSDVVGKEMADKIMKLDKPNEFSGEGLKIGGEGMKGFYDSIIPKAIEKLGKEHGVKVKQGQVPSTEGTYKYNGPTKNIDDLIKLHDDASLSRRDNIVLGDVLADMGSGTSFENAMGKHGNKYLAAQLGGELKPILKQQPIHYIDLPKSLKDTAIGKGFPLFSSTHIFTPVGHDPFKNEKKK